MSRCAFCKHPWDGKEKCCPKCRDSQRDKMANRRFAARQGRVCSQCGGKKEKIRSSFLHCRKCAARVANTQAEYRSRSKFEQEEAK